MTAYEEAQQYLASPPAAKQDFMFALAKRLDAANDALKRAYEFDNPLSLADLLPCPFCGRPVGYITLLHGCRVVCDYCDIYGPAGKCRADAMVKWNQRAKMPAAGCQDANG